MSKVYVLLENAPSYEYCEAEDCSCLMLRPIGAITEKERAERWKALQSGSIYNDYEELEIDDPELLNRISNGEIRRK